MCREDAMHTPEADAAAELEHRLGVRVPAADSRGGADDLVQIRLRLGVALEHRPLAALLVVEDEAESEPGAPGPLRIRRGGAVADEVAVAHDARRATASISTRTPAGNPACTEVRAGYGASKNST